MEKTVLVVDDDPMSREILWGYLTGEGYEVLAASGPGEARTILQKTGVDLILLDIMMPGEDGFSFCRYIKGKWQEPFLPVIIITALNDRQSKLQGLNCGADDFLSKPVDRIELIIKVRNMLKIRELHASLFNELLFAKRVQEHLFLTEYELGAEERFFYQPCRQVGGDLVEVWEQEGSRWAFLADASGHGPSAALIAAAVKALINKNAKHPASLLQQLNFKLCRLLAHKDAPYYVTGICIRADRHKVTWAGAGHPPCLLKTKEELLPLNSQAIPLGINPIQLFKEDTVLCNPGDWLLLYSDGLLDLVFEEELRELLQTADNRQQFYELLEKKVRQGEPKDDISFLGLTL